MSHGSIQSQLNTLAAGGEPSSPLALHAHLKRCPTCRAYFGELSARSSLAVDYSRIVAFARTSPKAHVRTSRSFALAAAAAVFATIIGCLLVAKVIHDFGAELADGERFRSQQQVVAKHHPGGGYGISAYCVVHAEDAPPRFEGPEANSDEFRCGIRDELKFTYRAWHGRVPLDFMTIIGIDAFGAVRVYRSLAHLDSTTASYRIAETEHGEYVGYGESIALHKQHRVGRMRIYGLFTPVPIAEVRLRGHVSRLGVNINQRAFDLSGIEGTDESGHAVVLGKDVPFYVSSELLELVEGTLADTGAPHE